MSSSAHSLRQIWSRRRPKNVLDYLQSLNVIDERRG